MKLQPGAPAFQHCLNSGTFLFRRSPRAVAFLEEWWALGSAAPAAGSKEFETLAWPFAYDVRLEWPWEQGPVHVAAARHVSAVQVVPHPHRHFMNWPIRPRILMGSGWAKGLPVMPYCLR